MAKRLLDGYKIGGDIIDRVSPMAEAAFAVPSRSPEQNTVGHSPAVYSEGIPEQPFQSGDTAAPSSLYNDRATIGGTDRPLSTVAEFYHRELTTNRQAQAYLSRRQLLDWPLIKRWGVGFADGRLVQTLSTRHRETLTTWGVLHDNGQEVLNGCLVVPLKDASGAVVGLYGLSITDNAVLQLTGKQRGLINRAALAVWREQIIITASVLATMSLIALGIERVVPCHGTNGFTAEHLAALQEAAVGSVVIAFDADEAGRKDTETLAATLVAEGFGVVVIEPVGAKNWNEALINGLTRETVEGLISAASVQRREAKPEWRWQTDTERWVLEHDGLHYRVAGVKEHLGTSARVSVRLHFADKRYIDNVDLYSARSRTTFKEAAAGTLGVEGSRVELDLLALLDTLEAETHDTRDVNQVVILSPQDIALGRTLLESPDLFDQISADLDRLGYVGEERNKELLYLAASSRKLADPISVMVVSQSASGKSFLIDGVRRLMPPEDVVNLTSLSDQALNYLGEGSLMHKFVIMGEAVHSEPIEHQIREMLSAKELSRLVVTKDERSGKLSSTTVRTKAIVSVAMSSTKLETNPENLSRFFVAATDETSVQTKRIHESQRQRYSMSNWKTRDQEQAIIIARHQAAQRLLQPLRIVNPFATLLDFPDTMMRSRRDHGRFLDLIACVCFVRQFQKATCLDDGLEFIECDAEDYRIAYQILAGVLAPTLTNFPTGALDLFRAIRSYVSKQATTQQLAIHEISFTQRQLREDLSLGQMFIKRYLAVLVDYEYLIKVGSQHRGSRCSYRLSGDEELCLVDLTKIPTPEAMQAKISKVGQSGSQWV